MTAASAPAATTRLFGKCPVKGCATKIVIDPATDPAITVGENGWVTVAAAPRTPLGDSAIVGGGGIVFCAVQHPTSAGMTHAMIKWSGVKATLNRTECDARCQDSRAEVCKCSCGGARHGETA